jgi:hypothetical protein
MDSGLIGAAADAPRFNRRFVSVAKKPSTALSQDADVGVKWKVHRGCRASHWRTFGCLWVAYCPRAFDQNELCDDYLPKNDLPKESDVVAHPAHPVEPRVRVPNCNVDLYAREQIVERRVCKGIRPGPKRIRSPYIDGKPGIDGLALVID